MADNTKKVWKIQDFTEEIQKILLEPESMNLTNEVMQKFRWYLDHKETVEGNFNAINSIKSDENL